MSPRTSPRIPTWTRNRTRGVLLGTSAALLCLLGLTGCASVDRTADRHSASAADAEERATARTPPAAATEQDEGIAFEIAFRTHVDVNLPEQDVFIERRPGSGEVFRVTKGDNDMDAPLFAAATPLEHDPFDEDAVGPHARGKRLGMTVGQWLAHRGTGTYTAKNGTGRLNLSFKGLVPNGVYTMWHVFAAMPPTEPFSGTLDVPLGARDGSQSIFVADENGTAQFDHTFSPGLQLSDVWTTAMLAINYHSDGKTYGGRAGPLGQHAHVPLFVELPQRAGLE